MSVACSLIALWSCRGETTFEPGAATYLAVLSGAGERPPRSTNGVGTATFRVVGILATYDVAVANLSGVPTVAHLVIGGEQTAVGQVVLNLPVVAPTGTIAAGTIDLGVPITFNNSTISGDSLRWLFDRGTAFVNVYTTTYPTGEVRGQIVRRDQ